MVTRLGVASRSPCIAWRASLLLIGVAILLGMYPGRDPAPPNDARALGPGGILARDGDGTLRLTLAVPVGGVEARCISGTRPASTR